MALTVLTEIEVDSEAWAAFIEMRHAKGKRAPFTKEAEKRILLELKKLESLGYPQAEVLWQSVMNGWSGVFPLKHRTEVHHERDRTAAYLQDQKRHADAARIERMARSAVRKMP